MAKTPYWELPSFVQYSKRISTAVTVFWMGYRIINFLVLFIRPDVSIALVELVTGVDTVMICNIGFYMGKSGFENVAKILAGRSVLSKKQKEEEVTEDEDQLEG